MTGPLCPLLAKSGHKVWGYEAIVEMYRLLVDEYGVRTSPSACHIIDMAVRRVFQSRFYEHLGIALLHRQDGNWSQEKFECIVSPEGLSMIADMALWHGGKNVRHARDNLKKRLRKAVG